MNQRVLDEAVSVQLLELEAQKYRVLTDIKVKFYDALAAQRRIEPITVFKRLRTRDWASPNCVKKLWKDHNSNGNRFKGNTTHRRPQKINTLPTLCQVLRSLSTWQR